MAHSVTVRDIAKGASVSIATVSRVLNNQGKINEEVRNRVLKVAAELGYVKTKAQHNFLPEKTLKDIAFLLDYNGLDEPQLNTFWAHILHGAESEALKFHIRITYQGIRRNQIKEMLRYLLHELQAGGILLVGPSSKQTLQILQEAGLPLVLIDNYIHLPQKQIDTVLSDNIEGTREAMHYLISEGHRSIAFLGAYTTDQNNKQTIYSFEMRRTGYSETLREAGLPNDTLLIEEGDIVHPEEIIAACKRLMNKKKAITALMCASDTVAILALKALHEIGLRVPEDVSVVGFDNIEITEHLTPALTTIHVQKEAMGASAVRCLLKRVSDPESASVTTTVHTQLVKRDSVCPPLS